MAHVFISYSHQDDTEFFEKLKLQIQNAGMDFWTDEKISPGQQWSKAIDDSIKNAFVIVVVMTPLATASSFITYEWSFALGLGKVVIPVMAAKGTKPHPKLSELQYLDFTDRQHQPWQKLISALEVTQDSISEAEIPVGKSENPIVKRLTNKKIDRRKTIKTIVDLGYKEAIPDLINILEDTHEKSEIRQVAAEALGKLRAYEAIPSLLLMLRSTNLRGRNLHAAIIRALGELKAVSAVTALTEYIPLELKHTSIPDTENALLKAVLDALVKIGTPEALAAVEDWKRQQQTPPPPA
ncbi:MAG: TIR domain-containing protein [Anaerolineae bacterium]